MTSRKLAFLFSFLLLLVLVPAAPPAFADTSHARIIRLSLVQGDVRFARETHGDPLTDSSASWETAQANLPIRQGFVLSTDNGRAAVEFENGALALLNEHTVLEFYDLSLQDEVRTTRLILRQGSASFSINPGVDDYFSVTGGDFTVTAAGRCQFRLNTYDDGSSVEAFQGRVTVLKDKQETRLQKNQSLTFKVGETAPLNIGSLPEQDDFDKWVSGVIQDTTNATSAAGQYTSSPYYLPGFADLYTYGAFSNCGAYGFSWRPFGAGLSWSPFSSGQWVWDPAYGYTWLSYQPWGYAPYHYGGWLFDASCGGWFYSPPYPYGFAGYGGVGGGRRFPRPIHPPRPFFHPVTAVFVRQGNKVGIVPIHPLDAKGKTPLNLEHGVFSGVGAKGVTPQIISAQPGQKWETMKTSQRDSLGSALPSAQPPSRVYRTLASGNSGSHVLSLGKESSIAYDPVEHRFVNTNSSAASAAHSVAGEKDVPTAQGRPATPGSPVSPASPRSPAAPPTSRSASNVAPPSRSIAPPPAPRYSGGSFGGGSGWGGASSGRGSSGGTSAGGSSSGSSHPSGGSSGGGASGGGGSRGGGRP